MTKPFRLAELLARVRALLRRGASETQIVQGVRIDADARRAWLGEEEMDLTSKEFDLLSLLVAEAGKVVTREQIMRQVWDSKWWGSTKTLDMHVSWLRRKLGDDAHKPAASSPRSAASGSGSSAASNCDGSSASAWWPAGGALRR